MKKSSNRSGIEEVNKLTFIVAGSSALKNNPVWVPVSDIFVKSDREILKPLGVSSDNDLWHIFNLLKAVLKIIQISLLLN